MIRNPEKLVDLSHPLHTGMPFYPGAGAPEIVQTNRLDVNGFNEKRLQLYTHSGTHMDAPAHMVPGGKTLDRYPLSRFSGRALVIPVRPGTRTITAGDLAPFKEDLPKTEYVLFYTGWDRYWGKETYFRNYPVLEAPAAQILAEAPIKGAGFDCISVDGADASEFTIHHILLGAGLVLLENLTGLEKLPVRGALFSAFPLKVKEADGSPVRAVAWLDEAGEPGPENA